MFKFDVITLKGLTGAILAVVFPFLNFLMPILQFIGVILGIVLASVSLYIKIIELKKLNERGNSHKKGL